MNKDSERQKLILSIADEGFWDWDLKTDRLYLSPHYCELAGYSPLDTLFDTAFLKKIIHPDDHQNFFRAVEVPAQNKKGDSAIEYRMVSGSGALRWVECRSRIVEYDESGSASRIVGSITDITERKQAEGQLYRSNRALLAISQCNQALLRASNEIDLLNDICRIIVEIGRYRMAWVGYAEDDRDKSIRPVAQAGFEDGYLETLRFSWAEVDIGRGPSGTAIRTGQVCTSRNMHTDPLFEPWRTEAIKRGYASLQSLPLKTEQTVFGVINIYSGTPDAFDAEETGLLTSLAENLVYGITMLRSRKAREMAEEELRQSEARYRCLFENRHTVMLIIDPSDGVIVDANPAASLYYGWTRDELCRMNMSQISQMPQQEGRTEVVQCACRNEFNDLIFRHRLADGSLRDVDVVTAPITIQGKSLLYSIVHDITERKQFQELLLESHERMHLILNAANAGLWEYDVSSNFNIWSDEVWRLYGIEFQSCEPSNENWLNTIIPEDREKIRQSTVDTLNKAAEFNGMWRVRNPDGTIRWLMSKGTPFKDSEGEVLRYVGIVIDVTDRKMEEAKTRQLESRLLKAQRLEAIGKLTGSIAHDFNNILTPILGYAEMGAFKLSSEDRLHDYFTTIMLAARRARALISQILIYSRNPEINMSQVSVQSVISEVLNLLTPSIPTTVQIEQHIDHSCRNISADPSQIHQVILNLLTNALQAMEKSGGLLTIGLKEVNPGSNMDEAWQKMHAKSYVYLTVTDTGSGMDKATMEHIFEPFFTTKQASQGTGLGLSVVHTIITSYKGAISVDSQPGKGATFQVYLPTGDARIGHEAFDMHIH
jgi:PAS domain S-box-containing protein